MSYKLAFGIIGFVENNSTERDELMTQIYLTLDDEILKDLMLGDRGAPLFA